MKAPDRIYIPFYPNYDGIDTHLSDEWFEGKAIDHVEGWVEYIRKDIVDETIKTAEDHAYFAGQEKFREKLMEWIQEERAIPHENAITRDLVFQEVVNRLNSM